MLTLFYLLVPVASALLSALVTLRIVTRSRPKKPWTAVGVSLPSPSTPGWKVVKMREGFICEKCNKHVSFLKLQAVEVCTNCGFLEVGGLHLGHNREYALAVKQSLAQTKVLEAMESP